MTHRLFNADDHKQQSPVVCTPVTIALKDLPLPVLKRVQDVVLTQTNGQIESRKNRAMITTWSYGKISSDGAHGTWNQLFDFVDLNSDAAPLLITLNGCVLFPVRRIEFVLVQRAGPGFMDGPSSLNAKGGDGYNMIRRYFKSDFAVALVPLADDYHFHVHVLFIDDEVAPDPLVFSSGKCNVAVTFERVSDPWGLATYCLLQDYSSFLPRQLLLARKMSRILCKRHAVGADDLKEMIDQGVQFVSSFNESNVSLSDVKSPVTRRSGLGVDVTFDSDHPFKPGETPVVKMDAEAMAYFNMWCAQQIKAAVCCADEFVADFSQIDNTQTGQIQGAVVPFLSYEDIRPEGALKNADHLFEQWLGKYVKGNGSSRIIQNPLRFFLPLGSLTYNACFSDALYFNTDQRQHVMLAQDFSGDAASRRKLHLVWTTMTALARVVVPFSPSQGGTVSENMKRETVKVFSGLTGIAGVSRFMFSMLYLLAACLLCYEKKDPDEMFREWDIIFDPLLWDGLEQRIGVSATGSNFDPFVFSFVQSIGFTQTPPLLVFEDTASSTSSSPLHAMCFNAVSFALLFDVLINEGKMDEVRNDKTPFSPASFYAKYLKEIQDKAAAISKQREVLHEAIKGSLKARKLLFAADGDLLIGSQGISFAVPIFI